MTSEQKMTANNGLRFDPSAVVPKLRNLLEEDETRWFWVGLYPTVPIDHQVIGGVTFSKLTARLVADPTNAMRKVHEPVTGSVVPLTQAQLSAVVARLQRTVLRWRDVVVEKKTSGVMLEQHLEQPPQGFVLTIPSEAQVEEQQRTGQPIMHYIQSAKDRPIADYLYLVPSSSSRPRPLHEELPPPISETGIVWPAEDRKPAKV